MAEIHIGARRKYLQHKIESATPLGRVIILYDACIRFMNDAVGNLQARQKQKVEACEKIIRAQNIIRELRNALNLDLDPKTGGNLYRLYTFFLKRLMEANRNKVSEPIEYVIRQMTKLNDSWKEAESKGLGKDIKRYEDRLGTGDVNIIRKVAPTQQRKPAAKKNSGENLLETLNVRI